jgi:hypothetical protein
MNSPAKVHGVCPHLFSQCYLAEHAAAHDLAVAVRLGVGVGHAGLLGADLIAIGGAAKPILERLAELVQTVVYNLAHSIQRQVFFINPARIPARAPCRWRSLFGEKSFEC